MLNLFTDFLSTIFFALKEKRNIFKCSYMFKAILIVLLHINVFLFLGNLFINGTRNINIIITVIYK